MGTLVVRGGNATYEGDAFQALNSTSHGGRVGVEHSNSLDVLRKECGALASTIDPLRNGNQGAARDRADLGRGGDAYKQARLARAVSTHA